MFRILLVEDDENLNKIVCEYLRRAGYEVTGCLGVKAAYEEMEKSLFDLIISDIMMPQIDGFAFARSVREVDENMPIIFLTAREDFESKKKGFEQGIDDYLTKPVQLEELVLRVGALLRRAGIAKSKKLEFGNVRMDLEERSITYCGEEIPLTHREFNILYKLLSFPKKTFTRGQLLAEFWEMDSDTTPRAVDVYVTKLRDKFSGCEDFKIVTVRGLGYKAVIKEDLS